MRDYNIKIKDVIKEDIDSIYLALENVEGVSFYQGEILDVNFDCEKNVDNKVFIY